MGDSMMRSAVVALVLGLLTQTSVALNNGLARKPPLAYSNWNIVGCQVNETFMRTQADLLVKTGLKDAGYEYVIVDDCWSNLQRDADGKLVANSTNFPSGMKALGDYIHSLGLKFGMYSDAGNLTCQFQPGSLGHETTDAQSFADWGVDYLKYDNCHATADDGNIVDRYAAMSNALNKTGRPIFYSIIGWGVGDPWRGWGEQYGNSWRTDGDITPSWAEITRVLDNSVGLMRFSQPNAWADMDMLEVGVGALTFQEMRSHFAIWALMKSPLMLSLNLATISPDQLKLVSNPEILAVNQDDLLVPGDLVWKQGPYEVYAAPMADGSRAVALFNRHTLATQYKYENMSVQWDWIGLPTNCKATVRNIMDQVDLGEHTKSFSSQVIVHDALLLRITPTNHAKYNSWRPWTAESYISVGSNNHNLEAYIGGGVVLGLIIVPLMLVGIWCIGKEVFRRCRRGGRPRKGQFQRFPESSTPKAADKAKAHASPQGRGTEISRANSQTRGQDMV